MYETILKNIKQGAIFRRNPELDATLYVRDHYARSIKKFAYHPYDDFNKELFGLGSNMVYCDYDDLINKRMSYYIDSDLRKYKITAVQTGRGSGHMLEPIAKQ